MFKSKFFKVGAAVIVTAVAIFAAAAIGCKIYYSTPKQSPSFLHAGDAGSLFLENGYSLQGMETAFKRQGIRTLTGAFFSTTQLHKILTMPFCAPATRRVRDFWISQGCNVEGSEEEWDGSHGVMIYGRSTQKNNRHQLQPKSAW